MKALAVLLLATSALAQATPPKPEPEVTRPPASVPQPVARVTPEQVQDFLAHYKHFRKLEEKRLRLELELQKVKAEETLMMLQSK